MKIVNKFLYIDMPGYSLNVFLSVNQYILSLEYTTRIYAHIEFNIVYAI